jgi:hypothetical protein
MHLLTDSHYQHSRRPGFIARCQLRIWQDEQGNSLVILSELPDNPGMSVTNAADQLATGVVADFNLDPQRTRWVEHYPKATGIGETFDTITFTWSHKRVFYDGPIHDVASAPEWRRISREEIEVWIAQ